MCKSLGILEKDYFGLRYLDKNGEYLWINLRNPLQEQLVPGNRMVMDMRVKYFIKPQKILQPVTRLVGWFSYIAYSLLVHLTVVAEGSAACHKVKLGITGSTSPQLPVAEVSSG